MLTRDYVMRLVKQLAGALARVMGLRRSGRLEEALVALGDAQKDALGDAHGLVGKVDAETAAHLLGSKETVLMYAQILAERAEILAQLDDGEGARRSFTRALQMCLEARGMGTASDDTLRAVLAQALPHVDTASLSERHRTLLAAQA